MKHSPPLLQWPNVHDRAAADRWIERTRPQPQSQSTAEAFFGKELELLRGDAADHPTKYRAELLGMLAGATVDPYTRTSLLAEAVMDFFRPVPEVVKAKDPPPAEKQEEDLGLEYLEEDVKDLENLEAFWWLK